LLGGIHQWDTIYFLKGHIGHHRTKLPTFREYYKQISELVGRSKLFVCRKVSTDNDDKANNVEESRDEANQKKEKRS